MTTQEGYARLIDDRRAEMAAEHRSITLGLQQEVERKTVQVKGLREKALLISSENMSKQQLAEQMEGRQKAMENARALVRKLEAQEMDAAARLQQRVLAWEKEACRARL